MEVKLFFLDFSFYFLENTYSYLVNNSIFNNTTGSSRSLSLVRPRIGLIWSCEWHEFTINFSHRNDVRTRKKPATRNSLKPNFTVHTAHSISLYRPTIITIYINNHNVLYYTRVILISGTKTPCDHLPACSVFIRE